ncbi:MAG: fimbrillin family protein [Bacteroidales bacterium]|nr:fimbrillin family protein [Bacteroidales bacterium]
MKNYTITSLILCAGALLSCTKDISSDKGDMSEGQPFTVTLNNDSFAPVTRTVNDGMMTRWGDTDRISLFYSESGKELSLFVNSPFKIADTRTGRFEGTLREELMPEKNYDWYAIYPYDNNHNTQHLYTKGTGVSTTQTQTGNDSKAHLAGENCILIGKVENVPSSEFPSIRMKPAAAVIDFNVKNSTGNDFTVKEIKVRSSNGMMPNNVLGFNFTKPAFDLVHNWLAKDQELLKMFNLAVNDGAAYTSGSSAHFYATTLPVTLNPGDKIEVRVITSSGSQTFTKTLDESLALESGAIKTFNLEYTDVSTKAIQATHADIETLKDVKARENGRYYYETFDGWTIYSGHVQSWNGSAGRVPEGMLGVVLLGATKEVAEQGILKSPLIAGGCSKLSFRYFQSYNDIDFTVSFKDRNGNPIAGKEFNVTGEKMTASAETPAAEYSQEVGLAGEFYMEIRQNASKPTASGDYMAPELLLVDIAWTPFEG